MHTLHIACGKMGSMMPRVLKTIHRWLIESSQSASLGTKGKCDKHPGITAVMGDVTHYIDNTCDHKGKLAMQTCHSFAEVD